MAEFKRYTCKQLKDFLADRGIKHSDYRKDDLVKLAEKAVQHNVPVLEPDDHVSSMAKRRIMTLVVAMLTYPCKFAK